MRSDGGERSSDGGDATVIRVGGKDVFTPLAEKHFTHLLMVLIH